MRISDWSSDVCSSDLFVGDASTSPYEIVQKGGSVEHFNEEPGTVWMKRLTEVYHAAVWLNPIPKAHWGYSESNRLNRELMDERMYPRTLDGLDEAMRELTSKH